MGSDVGTVVEVDEVEDVDPEGMVDDVEPEGMVDEVELDGSVELVGTDEEVELLEVELVDDELSAVASAEAPTSAPAPSAGFGG